jgi:hypothetical protein
MVRALAWALIVFSVGGCFGGISRRDELLIAVHEYADGIRWGKIEQSAIHLPVERRQAFAEKCGALEDELEVVDYEVQRVELDRATDAATVRVTVSWSLKRRGIIERTVVEQRWEQRGSAWVLTKQSRLRGSPLTILD